MIRPITVVSLANPVWSCPPTSVGVQGVEEGAEYTALRGFCVESEGQRCWSPSSPPGVDRLGSTGSSCTGLGWIPGRWAWCWVWRGLWCWMLNCNLQTASSHKCSSSPGGWGRCGELWLWHHQLICVAGKQIGEGPGWVVTCCRWGTWPALQSVYSLWEWGL